MSRLPRAPGYGTIGVTGELLFQLSLELSELMDYCWSDVNWTAGPPTSDSVLQISRITGAYNIASWNISVTRSLEVGTYMTYLQVLINLILATSQCMVYRRRTFSYWTCMWFVWNFLIAAVVGMDNAIGSWDLIVLSPWAKSLTNQGNNMFWFHIIEPALPNRLVLQVHRCSPKP